LHDTESDVTKVAGRGVEATAGGVAKLGVVVNDVSDVDMSALDVAGIDDSVGTRLEVLATLAVEMEDNTLSAELVAVNEPEISVGVVPARDIVGVVGRP